MSVVFLTLIMLLTSLVIDVGIARIVRTDVQSLADTTALDMAAALDGTATTAQLLDPSTPAGTKFATAKSKTLARNTSSVGGNVTVDDVTVTLGVADSNGTWLDEASPTQYPNAVRVSVAGTTKTQLLPGVGTARPVRTAEAVREPKAACITVGSFLGALDTSNGGTLLAKLLNEVAPTSVDIFSAAGLVALKGVSVPLVDLAAELHVADPSKLLDTTVTVADLARASSVVLGHQSGSAVTAAVSALNAISANASAVGNRVRVGDILALGSSGAASVLAGSINVFDLVTSSVFAIDSNHVVDLQNLGLSIPGFTTVALKATIVNPPKTVCGGAGSQVTSSQVTLDADLTLQVDTYKKMACVELVTCLLGGLGQLVTVIVNSLSTTLGGTWSPDTTTLLSLKLSLGAVNATSTITSVGSCEPTPEVNVSTTTSATSGTLTLSALNNALRVVVPVPQVLRSGPTPYTFRRSPDSWTHVGGLGTNLIGPINLDTTLNNGSKAIVLNLSTAGINLGSQLTTALNNTLSGLGLSLNGANVSLSKMGTCDGFGLRK
jgi:hypothetical protein